jgi:hypothetical protein
MELVKMFTWVGLQYYVAFHREKAINLQPPFLGFEPVCLKMKPDFGNKEYDENKLRVKYSKVKLLMNGNISLMNSKFRLFEKNFFNFSNSWVEFKENIGKFNTSVENGEKEKNEKKEKPQKSGQRVSIKDSEFDKKSDHLNATAKFFRKQTYMKKNSQRRNSNLKLGKLV